VLAGNLERAGLWVSSSHVSHDARRVQHEAASVSQQGSVIRALDQLEVTVKRACKLINDAVVGGLPEYRPYSLCALGRGLEGRDAS
jgi:hypothetical protein